MPQNTHNVVVDDREIGEIIEAIGRVTKSNTFNAVVLGCLAAAIVTSYETISRPKLAEGVKLLSETLALWIDDEDTPMTIH